ncbi:hypothetical protein ACOSP7_014697 [Xanthoceras sorbifolium]
MPKNPLKSSPLLHRIKQHDHDRHGDCHDPLKGGPEDANCHVVHPAPRRRRAIPCPRGGAQPVLLLCSPADRGPRRHCLVRRFNNPQWYKHFVKI